MYSKEMKLSHKACNSSGHKRWQGLLERDTSVQEKYMLLGMSLKEAVYKEPSNTLWETSALPAASHQ